MFAGDQCLSKHKIAVTFSQYWELLSTPVEPLRASIAQLTTYQAGSSR
jgi:hypothetical protein